MDYSKKATAIEERLQAGFDPSWDQLVILYAAKGILLVSISQRRKYGYCYISRQSLAKYCLFHTAPCTGVYFATPAAAWNWYQAKVEDGWFDRLPALEDKWQVELRRIADSALIELDGGKKQRRKQNGFTSGVWREISECQDAAALRLLLRKVENQIEVIEKVTA